MEIRHDLYTTFFLFFLAVVGSRTDCSSYRHLGVSYTDADNWTSSLLQMLRTSQLSQTAQEDYKERMVWGKDLIQR